MAADPRGHRRHRAHRAAGLARIQQLHLAGVTITCCLCGQPLDPLQPYQGGRNLLAPTIEHAQPMSSGGPLYQSNSPDMWAHRGCQSSQGGRIASDRRSTAAQPQVNSRRW
jgi:hypothetical protein